MEVDRLSEHFDKIKIKPDEIYLELPLDLRSTTWRISFIKHGINYSENSQLGNTP